jgi:hypothetical protein
VGRAVWQPVVLAVEGDTSCFHLGAAGFKMLVGSPFLADKEKAWMVISE